MSDMTIIIAVIGGIFTLGLVIWYFGTWNRLIALKERAEKSWSDIDVLLQQRYDELGNLLSTVKGYAKHEKEIFEKFAEARQNAASAASTGNVAGVVSAEAALGGMLPKIFALSEDYPELKADTNFLNLQQRISELEERVADRREMFNSSVTNWNMAIQMIPTVIVARHMNAQEKALFEVTNAAVREAPKLEF